MWQCWFLFFWWLDGEFKENVILMKMKEDRFADLDDIMSDQKVDFILAKEKAVPR